MYVCMYVCMDVCMYVYILFDINKNLKEQKLLKSRNRENNNADHVRYTTKNTELL